MFRWWQLIERRRPPDHAPTTPGGCDVAVPDGAERTTNVADIGFIETASGVTSVKSVALVPLCADPILGFIAIIVTNN